jgi:hypothetical protein
MNSATRLQADARAAGTIKPLSKPEHAIAMLADGGDHTAGDGVYCAYDVVVLARLHFDPKGAMLQRQDHCTISVSVRFLCADVSIF